MNTLIPGAPLRSLSPTTNEYQRAQGESRAAKPARAARFTLDAPEHSGTIPGARGDILTPGVALTSNLAVIFTLNRNTLDSARIPRAPKLLICGLFLKGRVLAQDGIQRDLDRFLTHYNLRSSLNFPVKSPYGSPRSVKLLIPPTCLAGEVRCEAPRLS